MTPAGGLDRSRKIGVWPLLVRKWPLLDAGFTSPILALPFLPVVSGEESLEDVRPV